MRILKIFLMLLLIFFCAYSTGCAEANNTEAKWQAQIWNYACSKGDAGSVKLFFKAIEIKNESEYSDALIEFINTDRPTSKLRAQAVYTLANTTLTNTITS